MPRTLTDEDCEAIADAVARRLAPLIASKPEPAHPRLVDAHGLLQALFDEKSRPSLRWVRNLQSQQKIPHLKLGHLIRFDVEQVRNALASRVRGKPRSW